MKCDWCGYIFKYDGTEDQIVALGFDNMQMLFCCGECYKKWKESK